MKAVLGEARIAYHGGFRPPADNPHDDLGGRRTRDEGMGLGLSLALQAITRHEGVIRIESVMGSGTTVVIWLPASMEASKST